MACNDQYQITVEPCNASGTNSTAISSPHIIQYPRQPKRDDGKWMSLGNIIGALIGKFANGDKLDQASDAEDTWEDLNDRLMGRGIQEWDRIQPERDLAKVADDHLADRANKDEGRSSSEWDYSEALRGCTDTLQKKLCDYVACGYQPDYDGILSRARADAQSMASVQLKEACRIANRYNTGMNRMVHSDILRAEMLAVVGATTRAREEERATMWKVNSELLFKGTEQMESMRVRRSELSRTYGQQGIANQSNRYAQHNDNGYKSLQIGSDMLASAGQNFAWLAESLRRSAEKDTGNFAALGALIGVLLPQFFCGGDVMGCNDECAASEGG